MDYNELLDSIINDDLVTFEKLTRPNSTYNVCFGRFPALSLCYMYGAITILKTHEGDMLKFSDGEYVFADETIKVYEDFKAIAEKCLRFYLNGKKVEPIEMLALLGKSSHLRTIWGFAPKKQEQYALIEKIYALKFDRECLATEERLVVPDIKIKDEKKRAAGIWALGSFAFTIVLAALLTAFMFVIGLGTQNMPLKVYNGNTLVRQAGNSEYIKLCSDVTVEETIDSSAAVIDGCGHTIKAENKAIFKTFTGKLTNVKISFSIRGDIKESVALIMDNQGVLNNVTVNAVLDFTEETEEDNVYVAVLTVNNSGEIDGCSATVSANCSSNGEGNAYLAGICGVSTGRISNVTVSGEFEGDTVYIAGVCVENSGEIDSATNKANVLQTSAYISEPNEEGNYSLWNPNCGGVVLTNKNEGSVQNCANEGNVTVLSKVEIPMDDKGNVLARAEAFSGGIAAINLGRVVHCKNLGEVKIESSGAYAYIGGVVACNTTSQISPILSAMGVVENCYSKGTVIVDTTVLTLAGGIVGYNAGGVAVCFTDTVFEKSENENQAIGGIIGMDLCDMAFSQIVYNSNVMNNYSVKSEVAPYAIGALSYRTIMGQTQNILVQEGMLYIDSNQNKYVGQYNYAIPSLDDLKESEVYWE